eukprot:tig00000269_g23726.t1
MSGRKSKRARLEKPARIEDSAEAARAAAAAAVPFDALPDAVLCDVFKALGLCESWPLRGVCRRWRRVVEETEWAIAELRIAGGRGTTAAGSMEALAALFDQRKLRLGVGASIALAPVLEESQRAELAELEERHALAARAACGVLAAAVRAGPAPRAVAVNILSRYRYEDIGVGSAGESFVRDYVLGVLGALRPPAAEGAAISSGSSSSLENLSIGLSDSRGRDPGYDDGDEEGADGGGSDDYDYDELELEQLPWPEVDKLRAALAPFAKLRSLSLFFNELDAGATPDAAEAIAAACPLLRSVCLRPFRNSAGGVLAALAPLARLEELVVSWLPFQWSFDAAANGFVALANGPAGQSLRKLEFVKKHTVLGGHGDPKAFSGPSADSSPWPAPLPEPAVAALARMPKLQSIQSLEFDAHGHLESPASLRALGRARGLRELHLALSTAADGPGRSLGAELLRTLPSVLSGLPLLKRLGLNLAVLRPPFLTWASRQILRGLRPGVSVHVDLIDPEMQAAARAVLAGRHGPR